MRITFYLINIVFFLICFFGIGCNKNSTRPEPEPLVLQLAPTHVSIYGGSDGSINLTVSGGTEPYQYQWSNGETTEDISHLVAGPYSVVVNDAEKKTICDSVILTEPFVNGLHIVGIYSDNGAAEGCVTAASHMFEWMEFDEVRRIYAEDLNTNQLNDLDLIYFPGGSTPPYRQKITNTGVKNLRDRIHTGCGYIGTCAGALIACERNIWEGNDDNNGLFELISVTGIGPIPQIYQYPDIGMCQVNYNEHILTADFFDEEWILYYNGPYFQINYDSSVSIIGNYDISGHPAIVAAFFGNGRVFLTGPHPEFEEDSNRDEVSYFDQYEDHGSDWPLMKKATEWCLQLINN